MKRTLKIRCDGPQAHSARVWLNDFEITEFLTGLALNLEVGELNHAELQIMPTEIDIDAESLVVLSAFVKEQAA